MRRVVAALTLAVAATFTLVTADAAAAKRAPCTKPPFAGIVSREPASTGSGQHEGIVRKTKDIRSALVFDFGNRKNYTVYVSDRKLDPKTLGSTLTAPAGTVLVTMFLRSAAGGNLRAGQRLDVATDPVSVLVDSGGGAETVSSNKAGSVKIVKLTDSLVCYKIDYQDDVQRVKGTVAAKIP